MEWSTKQYESAHAFWMEGAKDGRQCPAEGMASQKSLVLTAVSLDGAEAVEDQPVRLFGQAKFLLLGARCPPLYQVDP